MSAHRKSAQSDFPRKIARFTAGLFTLLIIGCGSADDEPHLTYWCATNSFEIEFARQIVDEWNADTTRLRVKFQPVPAGQSSEEVIIAAIVGRTTPDIYSNVWPGTVEQYREAGAVLEFDQFADFDSVNASRLPASLREGFRSPNGKFYQLPWKTNPLMLFYNKSMLEEAGITQLPKTYAEFMEIAPKLVKDFNNDGHFDTWMLDPRIIPEWWQRFFDYYTFYIAATQGKTMLESGATNFKSAESIEVLKFFRDGFQAGYFPNSIFQEDIFVLNKLAFKIAGPWQIAHLKRYRPDDYDNFGVTTLPRPSNSSEPVYTYGDPKSIVIFSNTKYPQDSWEFVKFMTSRVNDLRLLQITNQLPIRDRLLTDEGFKEYFEDNPNLQIFAEQVPYIVGTDHSIYLQEIFDILGQEFDAACVHQVKTVEQAAIDLDSRISVLLKREHYRDSGGSN